MGSKEGARWGQENMKVTMYLEREGERERERGGGGGGGLSSEWYLHV